MFLKSTLFSASILSGQARRTWQRGEKEERGDSSSLDELRMIGTRFPFPPVPKACTRTRWRPSHPLLLFTSWRRLKATQSRGWGELNACILIFPISILIVWCFSILLSSAYQTDILYSCHYKPNNHWRSDTINVIAIVRRDCYFRAQWNERSLPL